MKKRILLPGLFCLLLAQTTFSQKNTSDNIFIIKTDLVFLAINFLDDHHSAGLTFEKGFAKRHSLQVTGNYNKRIGRTNEWRFIPEYKFYFKREGFKGFYAGVYLKYIFDKEKMYEGYSKNEYYSYKYLSSGAGLTFGFQTYIWKHLTLDVLIGGGLRIDTMHATFTSGKQTSTAFANTSDTYPALRPDGRLTISLGYRF